MKVRTVMWWLAFGVSAIGPVASASDSKGPAAASSAAPASSSTAAASAAASAGGDASKANGKGTGSGSGDSTGTAKATLASWLDLLAAQRANAAIVRDVAGSIDGHAILVSSWPDYVRAVDAGRVTKGQITNANMIIVGYKKLYAVAQKASNTATCGAQKVAPANVNSEIKQLFSDEIQINHTLGGWLPDTFNPWLAAVQTMVGSVKSISDALRPSLDQPSPVSIGLAADDLYPAPSNSIPEIYVPPVITASRNGDIDHVVQHAQGLAGQMTQLATDMGDRSACKALAEKVTQSATALQSVAKALQPNPDGTSAADEALALLTLSNKPSFQVLDIHLTNEDATDRGYQNLIPTSKRLMQSSVLARYRLMDGKDGHVVRSGTVAVFCQVVAREGVSGAEAFGKKHSADDLCTVIQ